MTLSFEGRRKKTDPDLVEKPPTSFSERKVGELTTKLIRERGVPWIGNNFLVDSTGATNCYGR